jgi:SAM-dependent methyltransferase/acyl carrier protein
VIRGSEEILSQVGVERSRQWQLVNCVAGRVERSVLRAVAEQVVSASQKAIADQFSGEAFVLVERYGMLLLIEAMQRMGALQRAGEEYEKDRVREQLGIVEGHWALFGELLAQLNRAGMVEIAGAKLRVKEGVEDRVLEQERSELEERLHQQYPAVGPHVALLKRCLEAYPQILRGEANALEALFPAGGMELVEKIHGGEGLMEVYGRLQAQMVRVYVEERLKQQSDQLLSIVEVGAGTGGSSAYVLEALQPFQNQVRYLYSDVSRSFLEHGRKRFASVYGSLSFALLDVEADPLKQGYEAGSVDLIIGSNVLHATRRIERSLTELKKLLKTNGVLLLTELTRIQSFAMLTFGLTEGWWRFEDPSNRLAGSPLLSQKRWLQLLKRTGFDVLVTQAPGCNASEPAQDPPQTLILAQSDGLIALAPSSSSAQTPDLPGERTAVQHRTDSATAGNTARVHNPGTFLSSGCLEQVIEYTRTIFAEVLKIGKEQFNARATFETYGVDSLMVLELSKRLEKDLGKLPSTLLFEYSSIEALSRYLLETHREALNQHLRLELSPDLGDPGQNAQNGTYQKSITDREQIKSDGEGIDSLDAYVDTLSTREVDALLSIFANGGR